jgi:translation initiation factor IF-2
VLGLGAVPSAGDQLTVVENESAPAKSPAYRQSVLDKRRHHFGPGHARKYVRQPRFDTIEFPMVVKADVQGSVEAIVNAVNKISTDEISVRVLHSGVGAITESDVTLPPRPARRSSASTSGPTPRRARPPRATRSSCATTTSSTTSPTG